MWKRSFSKPALLLLLWGAVGTCAAQTLETETARLLSARQWKLYTAYEFQTSSDGRETAVPLGIEYGLTDNLEFLFEPAVYTAIRPNQGRQATGSGDTEATLTFRFRQESRAVPALAVAAEAKFPTAHDSLIGTGETDYTAYLIASKRFGHFDTHANVSYTFIGSPPGAHLNNLYGFALATVYKTESEKYQFFGEVLGNSSSGSEAGDTSTQATVVPEAAGGELVETLGFGRYIQHDLLLYLAVSHDNNGAVQFRPGFTFRF